MRLTICMLVLALAGCATPYGPRGLMGGYDERRLSEDEWWLEVSGNGFTSGTTLRYYFERRARELCGGPYTTPQISSEWERGGSTYTVQRGWAGPEVREHPGALKGALSAVIRCPPAPPSREYDLRCTMDAECSGYLICEQGRCVAPK